MGRRTLTSPGRHPADLWPDSTRVSQKHHWLEKSDFSSSSLDSENPPLGETPLTLSLVVSETVASMSWIHLYVVSVGDWLGCSTLQRLADSLATTFRSLALLVQSVKDRLLWTQQPSWWRWSLLNQSERSLKCSGKHRRFFELISQLACDTEGTQFWTVSQFWLLGDFEFPVALHRSSQDLKE